MSIQTDLTRIKNAKAAIKTAIEGKGVTVPDGTLLDGMAALIESIEAGGGGGNLEMSCGIITPATAIESISWNHGLSKPPDFVLIFLPKGYSFTTYANILRAQYKKYSFAGNEKISNLDITSRDSTPNLRSENSTADGDIRFTISDTEVIAGPCKYDSVDSTTRTFCSGKPYHWICISNSVVFPYQ